MGGPKQFVTKNCTVGSIGLTNSTSGQTETWSCQQLFVLWIAIPKVHGSLSAAGAAVHADCDADGRHRTRSVWYLAVGAALLRGAGRSRRPSFYGDRLRNRWRARTHDAVLLLRGPCLVDCCMQPSLVCAHCVDYGCNCNPGRRTKSPGRRMPARASALQPARRSEISGNLNFP
jgi:hypothetical protein